MIAGSTIRPSCTSLLSGQNSSSAGSRLLARPRPDGTQRIHGWEIAQEQNRAQIV